MGGSIVNDRENLRNALIAIQKFNVMESTGAHTARKMQLIAASALDRTEHTQDHHCYVMDGECVVCRVVFTGVQCPECEGQGFHKRTCAEMALAHGWNCTICPPDDVGRPSCPPVECTSCGTMIPGATVEARCVECRARDRRQENEA